MASFIYNRFKANLMNKVVNLASDTIKVALMGSGHSASTTADNVWGDVSANELASGDGYTTGGETLTGKLVTQASATMWSADDTEWTSSTFTAYYAVIYDVTATSNLICSIDFGGPVTVLDGHLTLQWTHSGIFALI